MMIDWTGTLVIGVLITGLAAMAKTCGLRGQRGLRADASSPRPEPQIPSPGVTSGFRDPSR